MDPLSPFKSASAFQSPWSSSPSPSSSNGPSASRHRATASNGSATGYRSSPLPQSASTPGGFGGAGGMTSGASAWGGEETYNPPMSGNGGAESSSAGASGSGRNGYEGDMAAGPSSQAANQQQQQQYFLRVKITAIERNRKDMLLRFDASTNLPNYRATIYRNMQRSYAEFQRFAEQAQVTSPQTIISALPLASSSALTDEEDDRLVRIALQRWFSRICEDPVLMRDEELRNFVESDFGYSPTPPPSARRTASTASAVPSVLSAALSKVVKRGPLEEDDELASAKAALEKLEVTWGGAASGVNAMGKARRAASQDVGGKLISLSTVESDFGLQGPERKVGRALETVAGVSGAQAASENIVLADTLGYQALNARAAKDALIQRSHLLELSQTASKTAIQKRRVVERLKGSSAINPAKVDDAIAEMDDANTLESTLTRQLQAISTNLHLSLRQHSRYTHEDAAMALLENARLTVAFQKQGLRELEIARAELGRVGEGGSKVQGRVQGQRQVNVEEQGTRQQQQQQQAQWKKGGIPPQIHTQSQAQHQQEHQPLPRQPIQAQPQQQQQQPQPGTQSMFLPSQHQQRQAQAQQAFVDPRQQNGSPYAQNPSHSPSPYQQQQQQQQQYQHQPQTPAGMAQSMIIPPSHTQPHGQTPHQGGQPGQRQGTMGRNGRKLDERQAARMLAGGF